MKKLILIAAVGKNLELGFHNNLIWHLKKDLANFKKLTSGHYILMGKNTYNSLPKTLSNRKYIVLSSTISNVEGLVFKTKDEFMDFYKNINEEVYVIGGAQIYKTFLDFCDELILTEIEATAKNVDTYFPKFCHEQYEKVILEEDEEEGISYKIVKYIKKNQNCNKVDR